MKNIGLYIHFPYCVHKCSYCDFFSVQDMTTMDKMVNAINEEIKLRCSSIDYSEYIIESIFFGGGTPSLMLPKHLELLLSSIEKYFQISSELEFTMECNPGTVDLKYISEYKSIGLNRISFGVQSFEKSELEFLERIHNVEEVYKAVDYARLAGFNNINIDMIYAIPGQTLETWQNSLYKLFELQPEHFSAYSLIYEPGTPLHFKYTRGKVNAIDEDTDYKFYETLIETSIKNGYEQYEVSNFTRNGKYCRHNLNYWAGGEYIAFGPSAHGYLNGRRYWNIRKIISYIKTIEAGMLPEQSSEILTLENKLNEIVFLGLRANGVDVNTLQNQFNIKFNHTTQNLIDELIGTGRLKNDTHTLKLTHKGYFTADEIAVKLCSTINV